MKEINRSILTVRAKEPFLHWLNSLPDPVKIFMMESTVAIPGNFLGRYMPRPKGFSTRSTQLHLLSF